MNRPPAPLPTASAAADACSGTPDRTRGVTRAAPLLLAVLSFAFFPLLSAQDAPAAPDGTEQSPASSVAEDAALLEKGRITSRKRALARLGSSPDPAADAVLIAQYKRYLAAEMPPAMPSRWA